ncbi:maleylacetoacetate isomerase [Polyangium jinanense]|uniref:Maleylacetoacetate isomerase n=1 Tax=Polyangium jinanense TaxID=2829994 RepID=A0A9X4AZC0_9BACT|nr:maleylacetoacetate isomerase [Polyangium jinanense]MDC3960253.1 maleylacetoacetate isomerase [Polyangium jinanense]MDC3988027.1 maleylacetoacetate isomerase [Polyangium jinanense]
MKLYGYWRSSCSYRVRIALHLKGIPFENIPVHLVKDGGEQFRDDYREKNPMAQVPTLEVEEGGVVHELGQSVAIIEWLEERYPERPLLPADSFLRARTRQLAETINAGIQPFQNLSVLKLVKTELGGDEQAFARRFIEKGLSAYQTLAGPVQGRFSVGDAPTVADVFLVPQLYAARRFGVDLGPFPSLVRIEEQCASLPAFQAAHPDRQIDAVAGGSGV